MAQDRDTDEATARAKMKIPNVANAIVETKKITRYLLNLEHDDGESKARFFLGHGFTRRGWRRLAGALRQHARLHEVVEFETVIYGVKYTVIGPMQLPDGTVRDVLSCWIIDNGSDAPRLVTAYPND